MRCRKPKVSFHWSESRNWRTPLGSHSVYFHLHLTWSSSTPTDFPYFLSSSLSQRERAPGFSSPASSKVQTQTTTDPWHLSSLSQTLGILQLEVIMAVSGHEGDLWNINLSTGTKNCLSNSKGTHAETVLNEFQILKAKPYKMWGYALSS